MSASASAACTPMISNAMKFATPITAIAMSCVMSHLWSAAAVASITSTARGRAFGGKSVMSPRRYPCCSAPT